MGSPANPLPFVAFGTPHLTVLVATALICWALVSHAQRRPGETRLHERILALFLLSLYPTALVVGWNFGMLNRDNVLPCHLCDVAAICGAAALWFRQQRLAELVWFWGLAGTMNGLISPALSESFPSPRFISFFALHGGVVIAAVYLVAGLGLRPQRGAVWRAFGWGQLYFLAALSVNALTGSNYGFLSSKPDQASPLDFMGPWPWYIFGMQAMALILFTVLYLPFRRQAAVS